MSKHFKKILFIVLLLPMLSSCEQLEKLLGIEDPKPSDIRGDLFEDDLLKECVALLTSGLRAKEVFDLVCSGVGISSLKGLEQFPNLRTLLMNTNRLSEVDLSPFPNLQFLDLSANRLKSIDLSHNPELREIYLDKNSLQSLSVQNNAKLEAVVLSGNNISELDVRHLPNLEELVMDENALVGDLRLGALDLSQNKNLINLNLFGNEITHIDVSQNTTLDYLDLRVNQLQEINLSANTNLTELRLNNNELTSLDVSALRKLDTVNAENNLISEIALPNHPDSLIRFAYLSGNQIACDANDCNGLSRFLIPANSTFIHLDLSDNLLSTDDIELNDNRNFTELLLSNNPNITGTFDLTLATQMVEIRLDGTDIEHINFSGYTAAQYANVFSTFDLQVLTATELVGSGLDIDTQDLLDALELNKSQNRFYDPDNPDKIFFSY